MTCNLFHNYKSLKNQYLLKTLPCFVNWMKMNITAIVRNNSRGASWQGSKKHFLVNFIYLSFFLTALGLHCCAHKALSSFGKRGLVPSCGAQALLPWDMLNLPGPGIKPISPALAGRFLSTVPPGRLSMWNLSSPTRDQTRVLCIARWILSHWTTREVPDLFLKLENEWKNKSLHEWLKV